MINSTEAQLFEEQLSLYGRQYSLAVYLMLKPDRSNYYRCIVDGIKSINLWIDDRGIWVDMQNGPSELSNKIGERIELRVIPEQMKAII